MESLKEMVKGKKGIKQFRTFQAPEHKYQEQVFFHRLKVDEKGFSKIQIVNPELNMKVNLKYNASNLKYLTEWKQMGEGDYVVGLEPGTNTPIGRVEASKRGELVYIEPDEKKNFILEISVQEQS